MIIVISPSKSINFHKPSPVESGNKALFEADAIYIISQLSHYKTEEIIKKEKVSAKMALAAFEYIQTFNFQSTKQKQAIFAFSGNVFNKLNASTLNVSEIKLAEKKLRIFSALYGILKPLDFIKPYRLDMGSGLLPNLYDFWKSKVTQEINKELDTDDILINLASIEYFKMLDINKLRSTRIITPVFKQEIKGNLVTNSLYAKQARGLMVRFILKNNISDPEHLKAFDSENYFFNPHLSKKDEWVFTR